MNQLANHFASMSRKLPQGIGALPMISVTAMAGVSALVRDSFGDKVLKQAKQAAMLDIELIEHSDCFIPQGTMTTFLAEVERRAGEPDFGLLVAPEASLAGYGRWGEYVLQADGLGAAIARAATTLPYHSTGDRIEVSVINGMARFCYFNAMRGRSGYVHVAVGTAGVMLSLIRTYLSADWRPRLVELDIPRPRFPARFEETFSCPVSFDAVAVTVCFDAHLLDQPTIRRSLARRLTLEDVARARLAPADLGSLRGAVVAQIWSQVLTGAVSIESAARAFDTSVRSLQRALNRDGTEFRDLVNAVRVRRASALLIDTRASITDISNELGYSAPANFARAFRQATGAAPRQFRRMHGVPSGT